ncbi:hypothetical protein Trydic_g8565 [Trypoxylus dichotomus]
MISGKVDGGKNKQRTSQLMNPGVAEEYKEKVAERIENTNTTKETATIEEVWNTLKTILLTAAKETCEVRRKGIKKHTAWWTEEIIEPIKMKKKVWKPYLLDQTSNSYDIYKNESKTTSSREQK